MVIKQGEVWLVSFDPSVGAEIQKTHPTTVNNKGIIIIIITIPATKPYNNETKKVINFRITYN